MNSDWRIPRTLTALVGTAIAIAAALAVYFGLLNFYAPVAVVPSPPCQAISHMGVVVGTPTPTPTPPPAPTPTHTVTPTPTPAATSTSTPTTTPAALAAAQGPSALPAPGGTPPAGASGTLPWVAAVIAGLAVATAGGLWAHSGRRA